MPMADEEKMELAQKLKDSFSSIVDLAYPNTSPELFQRAIRAFHRPKSATAATASLVTMYRGVSSVNGKRGRIPEVAHRRQNLKSVELQKRRGDLKKM
jgi:hypothetical protein